MRPSDWSRFRSARARGARLVRPARFLVSLESREGRLERGKGEGRGSFLARSPLSWCRRSTEVRPPTATARSCAVRGALIPDIYGDPAQGGVSGPPGARPARAGWVACVSGVSAAGRAVDGHTISSSVRGESDLAYVTACQRPSLRPGSRPAAAAPCCSLVGTLFSRRARTRVAARLHAAHRACKGSGVVPRGARGERRAGGRGRWGWGCNSWALY